MTENPNEKAPRPASSQGKEQNHYSGSVDLMTEWTGYFQHAEAKHKREELAGILGVLPKSLSLIGVGWDGSQWTIPEVDSELNTIGIATRAPSGRKGFLKGGHRGLICTTAIDPGLPVLVVEGPSDTAAMLTLTLEGIGRPSARGGVAHLIELLRGFDDVLIVGENDTNGVGQKGAERIAQKLADAWGKSVRWTLPPIGHKDVRSWLNTRSNDGLDLTNEEVCKTAGVELLAMLESNGHTCKPSDDADEGDGKKPSQSQASALVELARERYSLGVSVDGEPFAIPMEGPRVVRMLRGGRPSLRSELAAVFFDEHNKAPSSAALADAMGTIEGLAEREEPMRLHLRAARHGDGIVLDLGDSQGQCVVIEPGVWRIEDASPESILFRRSALTNAMPEPAKGGSLDDLRRLLNIADETWPLLVAWLCAALMPDVSRPILLLGGEQGTGKSTTAKMLVGMVDPSPAPLRTPPRNIEQWCVAAAGASTLAVDNLTTIQGWFSDALCRAVTGDGLIRRRLYSDSDLAVLHYRTASIITSIDPGALRGDLGDRLLLVDLDRIESAQRRTDDELAKAFEQARPSALGGLLDLLAAVLRRLPTINLGARAPRMVDFAKVVAAVDEELGSDGLTTYLDQRERVAETVVESSPVAEAIRRLIDDVGCLDATASEILGRTTPEDRRLPRHWPTTARSMSGHLRRLAPMLRQLGYIIESPAPTERPRLWRLAKREDVRSTVATVGPSENHAGGCVEPDSGPTIFSDSSSQPSEPSALKPCSEAEKPDPDDPDESDGEKHTPSIDLPSDDILDGIPI